MRMSGETRLFQIFYNAATRASLDPEFEPLDNVASKRPDWYEYWPMRRVLRDQAPAATSRYGFFSPLFAEKLRLSGRQVKDFVAAAGDVDVVTFSPMPCHGAVFYNVFEQGNACFPGFFEVAARFVGVVAPGLRLDELVNDSRNTVYSNFFVAKPAFWTAWGALCDQLYEHSEDPSSPLYEPLNRATVYAKTDGTQKPAQMKLFVMERIASLLLATRNFTVRNYPPFAVPLSKGFGGHLQEVMALDALKIAYLQSRDERIRQEFFERRGRLAARVWSGNPTAGAAAAA
jgi:hypothetical protein